MARIRSLERMNSTVSAHPTVVECGYQIVQSVDGPLLQLSTFGSDMRKSEKKVSQTLQLDRQIAAELVAILKRSFPGI